MSAIFGLLTKATQWVRCCALYVLRVNCRLGAWYETVMTSDVYCCVVSHRAEEHIVLSDWKRRFPRFTNAFPTTKGAEHPATENTNTASPEREVFRGDVNQCPSCPKKPQPRVSRSSDPLARDEPLRHTGRSISSSPRAADRSDPPPAQPWDFRDRTFSVYLDVHCCRHVVGVNYYSTPYNPKRPELLESTNPSIPRFT
jgi:hypothetical protein